MKKKATFMAYAPVGPGDQEAARAADLVESLCIFEPEIAGILLIDDGVRDAPLMKNMRRPRRGWLAAVAHPFQSNQVDDLGGVCVADLFAFSTLREHLDDIDFVLKCDTDALAIAPFAEPIAAAFRRNPTAGMVGTLGTSCNPKMNTRANDAEVSKILADAQSIALGCDRAKEIMDHWQITSETQKQSLQRITERFTPLLSASYAGEHCQGGSYAVSAEMIRRMINAGYLSDSDLWRYLPFAEDRMMGLYCALVGLNSLDLSAPGEVFGVQSVGLPYAPDELVQLGYSIVHSVKGKEEDAIRAFFRSIRLARIS